MKRIVLILLLTSASHHISAQDWATTIAPIVYSKCSGCHNSNGIAPFLLMSYWDAVDNASDIKDEVMDRHMPPWPPDESYSRLAHERILSQQEIDNIEAWVDNGTPRGDSTMEPAPPVFTTNFEITNPDLILSAPDYDVNTTNDLYRCFVLPTNLTTDQYLTAIESTPGNRNVVHHILIYSDTTNLPLFYDALDTEPGYTNFGGTGSPASKLIGVWVPGQSAYYAPSGMGIRLPANSLIVMQIHYPGGITGEKDSVSNLRLKLSPTFQREITIDSPLNHFDLDNGPLEIPANTTRTFYAHFQIPYAVSVMSVGPHMHLVGTKIKSWGITPTNDTIPFIDIPEWDFHWQGLYSFPSVIKLPAGTTVYSEAFYDNTTANLENPNNPPQLVEFGESTTDEMMLVYFASTPYQPGDENIIIDSSFYTGIIPVENSIVSTPQLYELLPNPANSNLSFQYFLPKQSAALISIIDINGKLIKEIRVEEKSAGIISSNIDVSDLGSGIYFLTLNADGVVRSKKFMRE